MAGGEVGVAEGLPAAGRRLGLHEGREDPEGLEVGAHVLEVASLKHKYT